MPTEKKSSSRRHPRGISRREFLKLAAGATGLLVGCTPGPQPTPTPTHTPAPTSTPPPTATPTGVPTATPTIAPPSTSLSQVAIAQADTYDRALVRQQVQALLDELGGLEDVVSSGDRVEHEYE